MYFLRPVSGTITSYVVICHNNVSSSVLQWLMCFSVGAHTPIFQVSLQIQCGLQLQKGTVSFVPSMFPAQRKANRPECCGIPMMRKHTADRWGYRGKHERTTRDMQEGDCRLKSVECTAENKLVMCQRQNGCDRDTVGRHKVPVSENQRWPAVKHLKHPQPDQLMIHKAGFGRLSHATYLFIYRVMFRVLKDILRELE